MSTDLWNTLMMIILNLKMLRKQCRMSRMLSVLWKRRILLFQETWQLQMMIHTRSMVTRIMKEIMLMDMLK